MPLDNSESDLLFVRRLPGMLDGLMWRSEMPFDALHYTDIA
jgi:hypothetical protein